MQHNTQEQRPLQLPQLRIKLQKRLPETTNQIKRPRLPKPNRTRIKRNTNRKQRNLNLHQPQPHTQITTLQHIHRKQRRKLQLRGPTIWLTTSRKRLNQPTSHQITTQLLLQIPQPSQKVQHTRNLPRRTRTCQLQKSKIKRPRTSHTKERRQKRQQLRSQSSTHIPILRTNQQNQRQPSTSSNTSQ